eukprot:scaffold15539_cov110-Isochrysis_galbana.AAC.1
MLHSCGLETSAGAATDARRIALLLLHRSPHIAQHAVQGTCHRPLQTEMERRSFGRLWCSVVLGRCTRLRAKCEVYARRGVKPRATRGVHGLGPKSPAPQPQRPPLHARASTPLPQCVARPRSVPNLACIPPLPHQTLQPGLGIGGGEREVCLHDSPEGGVHIGSHPLAVPADVHVPALLEQDLYHHAGVGLEQILDIVDPDSHPTPAAGGGGRALAREGGAERERARSVHRVELVAVQVVDLARAAAKVEAAGA